jgi:hypothetical protein
MLRFAILSTLLLAAAPARADERLRVDPDAGNSTFSAIFDAKLGERITATSSSVSCDVDFDERAGVVSGSCSVPLMTIVVDNEPTKTEHFREWTTNKKSPPERCLLEARFQNLRLGSLAPETPTPFSAEVPFTVCGRSRADGGKERVAGSAILFPAGSYGATKTLRVRATIQKFNRDAYRVGPKYTEGWLARVQSLAKVVAEDGTIELALFAKAVPNAAPVAGSSR